MTFPSGSRLVVLISGNGSNLQAICEACQQQRLAAEVVAVISNKADAFGLQRAANFNIPGQVLIKTKDQDRRDYDSQLAALVETYHPDWVILAGWMRILTANFLNHFPNRVINLHPALPGTFPGTHSIQEAYEAFRKGEITQTGIMVHFVPDEGVDDGPVIAQEIIPIIKGETLETLEERVHHCEHRLLVESINTLINKR